MNRKQKIKTNSSYNSWEEILFGVSQGSILGLLLFTIFVYELFLILKGIEFTDHADDNTSYAVKNNIRSAVKSLENTSVEIFEWFSYDQMKDNPNNCHFITNKNKDVM